MTREMKNSGIEWIGQIPADWNIIKSKYIFTNHKEIVGDREKDFERLSLTLNGVLKRPKDDSKGLQSESLSTYQILYKDELVFKMIDLENTSTSRVGYSPYTGLVSPVYIIFNNKEYSRYGYWYFYNLWQRNIYNTLGNNGVRSALNASDMLMLPFVQVPKEEMKKIADFLDSKVSEIDKMIAETKSSIENYKEYKQSVITEAVTKGLNKNVQMKDSDIEWIGQIPADWNITKYGRCATVKSNLVPPEEYPDYPQISPDNIEKGSGKLLDTYSTVAETGVISNNHLFFEGQIIYSKIRPLLNKVMIATFSGLCSADMYPIETTQHTKFLLYLMLSNYFITQVSLVTEDRVKMPKINQEELSNIIVVLPSLEEQKEIADFLDSKIAEIDNLISEKEALVSNLEEYKKALIYEYVTGKKTV